MKNQAYTLAMYRVKPGREDDFVLSWNKLADTFSSLPHPPLWGTLIRHLSDPTLFYSFGPWHSHEHVQAMRQHPGAGQAFEQLHEFCEEVNAGDYEIVAHIDVQRGIAS